MLDNIADGLFGLFVFIGNWFSPGDDVGEIRILEALESRSAYTIQWTIRLDWNRQIGDLVDAGVPLRFLVFWYGDVGDTVAMVRTLSCDVATYTYQFTDTVLTQSRRVRTSESTSRVYEALRDFARWRSSFPLEATRFHMEAVLLPSHVSQLGRTIDMSDILGCRRFARDLARKDAEG